MLGVTMERSCGGLMKTLIVGAGALGGIIGARLLAVGASVSLATRNATSAEEIKARFSSITRPNRTRLQTKRGCENSTAICVPRFLTFMRRSTGNLPTAIERRRP